MIGQCPIIYLPMSMLTLQLLLEPMLAVEKADYVLMLHRVAGASSLVQWLPVLRVFQRDSHNQSRAQNPNSRRLLTH